MEPRLCVYVEAKGMHLFVPHTFQGQPQGEVCHGCGIRREDA